MILTKNKIWWFFDDRYRVTLTKITTNIEMYEIFGDHSKVILRTKLKI